MSAHKPSSTQPKYNIQHLCTRLQWCKDKRNQCFINCIMWLAHSEFAYSNNNIIYKLVQTITYKCHSLAGTQSRRKHIHECWGHIQIKRRKWSTECSLLLRDSRWGHGDVDPSEEDSRRPVSSGAGPLVQDRARSDGGEQPVPSRVQLHRTLPTLRTGALSSISTGSQ